MSRINEAEYVRELEFKYHEASNLALDRARTIDSLERERDLARSQLETAVGALDDIDDDEVISDPLAIKWAHEALERIEALATIQQPQGSR